MRKFIHSNFEIDLSKLKISDNFENPWFSDRFFVKFTFPFDMDLSEENDINFGFISHYNANSHILIYEGKYVHRDIMEDAVLEIEEVSSKITLTLRYGQDEFPNFSKKLSELPLDKFEVSNIYNHAAGIISQTWPAVNYNFPQIHIDKIDNSDDPWMWFEKIINNYKDGAFLINEVIDDVTYNRNIMQPTPYALHILKKGFEDAGKTLYGDVLTDERIKKLCIYADADYWTTLTQESYSVIKLSSDRTEASTAVATGTFPSSASWMSPIVNPTYDYYKYFAQVDIAQPGKYRIIGKIKMRLFKWDIQAWYEIKYRNQVIGSGHFNIGNHQLIYERDIDIVFETLSDLNPNFITIESYQGQTVNETIIEVNINPIRLHNMAGDAIPTIINQNQIDLTRAVPDITFGDFVNALKNWFNLDLDLRGAEIHMNYIQNEVNRETYFDLSNYEIQFPLRKFTRGTSYLLKFQDVESKDYKWLPVYQSYNQIMTTNFKKDDKTNEIEINALPLQLTLRNGVQTAHAFDADKSKIYAVVYDGLTGVLNLAKDPHEILIPQVHARHWRDWITYRINSQGFQWQFIAYYEDIIGLKHKGKVFAYSNRHVVKSINRTEIAEDLFEIDITTEAEL